MKFLLYQTNWIEDKSRLKILEKSRRIGGTFSTSYAVFRRMMSIKNHDVTVITRDQLTAGEFVRDVTKWIIAWNNTCAPSKRIPMKNVLKGRIEIPHSGGTSRLLTASSNPDSAAGRGGDLIIDEFALHKDQNLLVTVAKPIITAGGSLTILSTHRSKASLFNKYVMDAQLDGSPWSSHKTTMIDAIEMGFVENVVNPNLIKVGEKPMTREEYLYDLRYNIINDEAIWDQEYMCMPSEEQYTLIAWELICQCAEKNWNDPARYEQLADRRKYGTRYLGWDIAESEQGDYSVMFVVEKIGNRIHIVDYLYLTKGTQLPEQREILHDLVTKWKVQKICVDNVGIGRDSWRILERKYGSSRVEGFTANVTTKAEICSKMLSLFQSGEIEIPNDEQLMKDINSVEKIYTRAGNVTYQAQRIDGSHGDGFFALAMAIRCIPDNTNNQIQVLSSVPKDIINPFESRQERNHRKDTVKKHSLNI